MTLRLKSCPKCGGDVRVDRDEYGWFEQCIQCGHTHDLEPISIIPRKNHPQKSENWYQDNLELRPIIPLTLSPEIERGKKARTLR